MFRLFKDLKILYFVLALAIGIPIVGFGVYKENILIMLLAFVITFIVSFVMEIIAGKRFNKINQIREKDCNIAGFYEALNELRIKCRDKKIFSVIQHNISVAFLDLGRYSDALSCLLGSDFSHMGKGVLGLQNQITYFNNLALCYIELGDFEKGEQALNEMKSRIENPKISSKAEMKSLWFDFYNSKKTVMEIKKGNFEGAEQIFSAMLDKATKNIEQVFDSYWLAYIYINTGRPEEAKRYIDFILTYGGDTIYKARVLKLQNQGGTL